MIARKRMVHIARIIIYPVKSLAGVAVASAKITPGGALDGDRALAMFDDRGNVVNGKRHPAVHHLRSSFDPVRRMLHLRTADASRAGSFHIDREKAPLESWLTNHFHTAIRVEENTIAGFPDDTDAPGPTIVSTDTLAEVSRWFPPSTVDSMRRRFRANLELDGTPAFWEDCLYRKAGTTCRFQIGGVVIEGTNPCQRCVVPPRDPSTGETYPHFAKGFIALREQTLPAWAERSRFNHFYRLAVNTKMPADQVGRVLHVGDEVKLISQ